MCILIVLCDVDPEYPIVVAGNRDELRRRGASPPGLWVGERHRVLSPRDRLAGGTWMAVGDQSMFAGLTNFAPARSRADAPSRGHLPHLALDQDDLDAAVAAVSARVQGADYNGFQLVLCDGERTVVLEHEGGVLCAREAGKLAVVTNEHRLGELSLELEPVLAAGLSAAARLELLRPLLCDSGGGGRHPILKRGETYGAVSSSLIAVHRDDPRALVWHYAPGAPDAVSYRNYGNLGKRLCRG